MKKRLIALILSAAMCVGMIGQTTFAAQAAEPAVETETAQAAEKVQSQADEDPLAGVTGYATPLEAAENELLTPSPRLSSVPTEAEAYQAMIAMKAQYPEGMRWTNDNYYTWNGGIFDTGYGCAGFAFLLSDAAFGDLPARSILRNININKIHVGDILRINGDTHSVVCLARTANSITIAEGNYNSSIHWGRTLTAAQIAEITDYVLTRYPLGTFGNYYTVSYADEILPTQYKDEGWDISLPTEVPRLLGHRFLGWATAAGSSRVVYQPGDSYSADANITLFPVWERQTLPLDPSAQSQTITITEHEDSYFFTPEKTDLYVFKSLCADGDPAIEIINTETDMEYGADDTEGYNYELALYMTGGTQYTIRFRRYDDSATPYNVRIQRGQTSFDTLAANALPRTVSVLINSRTGHTYLFTPEVTGTYTFQSMSDFDTKATLSGPDSLEVHADDNGSDLNFLLSQKLTAGIPYLITFGMYEYESPQSYNVRISLDQGPTTCAHNWTTTKPALAPTCTSAGYTEEIKCSKCGQYQSESTPIPATGHSPRVTKAKISATLFEDGRTEEVSCGTCRQILTASTRIPALKNTCGKLPVDMKKLPATTRVTAAGVGENAYWFIPEADGVYFFHSNYCPGVHFMVADDSHFLIDKVCSGGDLVSSQLLKKGVKYYIALGFLAERTDMTFDLTIAPEGSPEPPAPTNPFKDVSPSAWYYNYVLEANRLGIMTGTKPDTFNPAAKVTRGVFATVLYRLDGSSVSYKKYFPDVPGGVFYSEPITWAKESGVITGYNDGTFGPAKNVTREQIALILYRYTTEYRKFSSSTNADLSKFVDGSRVSSFARDGMKWAVANGIITGTADNRLNPQGTASRAEIATMIVRYISKFHP